MPQIEGGQSRQGQTGKQTTGPGGSTREVYDLVIRALLGNLVSPQKTDIPVPLQQAVSGVQDILPSLFAQGFGDGASRGLASRLSGSTSSPMPTGAPAGAPSSAALPTSPPSFGRTMTREELGLSEPSVVDRRYLPPVDKILAEMPPVRTTTPYRKEQRGADRLDRMQARRDLREAQGLGTRRLDRKIARTERRRDRHFV